MRTIISGKLLSSASARPAPKPYEIRDARLKGFILRVQPSGVRTYYAEHGRGRRTRIGAVGELLPDEARERCEKVLGNVAHGRRPMQGIDGMDSLTLGDFIGREPSAAGQGAAPAPGNGLTYRTWLLANRAKSAPRTLQRIQTCFGKWYDRALSDVTLEAIETWKAERLAAGRSAGTVLRDVMTLSGVLTRAVKMRKLAENPIRLIDKPKIDRTPKVRYLDREEEQRLRAALRERDRQMQRERASANAWRKARKKDLMAPLAHFGDHLTPAVLLSMNTGLRRGELLALNWSALDTKHRQLTIEGDTAKSSQTRHIPLNDEALDVLTRWREQTPHGASDRIIPIDTGFKTAFAALLERAQIKRFRWHDLRHHFASRLAQAGVPLNTVRELLGHGSMAMTLRYAHLAPDQKREAVAKLNQPATTEAAA